VQATLVIVECYLSAITVNMSNVIVESYAINMLVGLALAGLFQFMRALTIILFMNVELNWTKLYQYPKPRLKNTERQLMVRPCFPSVYLESKLSEIKTISELVVVVNDVWKVGDFVDWWTDGCYWSGRLTKALGNDKYKVTCLFYLVLIHKMV
jgi:hypothetical protein